MYCSRCGNPLPEGSNFCTRCGVPTAAPQVDAQDGYRPQPYVPATAPPKPVYPMKWFKFTIYFQLFANALLNLFNGIVYLTGTLYGSDADMVYLTFSGLKALDLLMGILYLGIVVLALVTRFRLAKFRRNGPMLLYIFLAVNLTLLLFYLVAASLVTGISMVSSSAISNAVTLVILLICDYIYFNKRKELFVH